MNRLKHIINPIIKETIEQHQHQINHPHELMILAHIKDVIIPFIRNTIIEQQHYEIYDALMLAEEKIYTHIRSEGRIHDITNHIKIIDTHEELHEKIQVLRKEFKKNIKAYNKLHKL